MSAKCTTTDCEYSPAVWGWFDDGQTRTRVLYCKECARDLEADGYFEPGELHNDTVTVRWNNCDCEWSTKYCDDNHTQTSRVPRETLLRFAA